ncbi:unnamed protein product [Symbiodinium sp. CCMP2592]|nr:unnamed protein product [Symbiodinium sp. CCMP2592]
MPLRNAPEMSQDSQSRSSLAAVDTSIRCDSLVAVVDLVERRRDFTFRSPFGSLFHFRIHTASTMTVSSPTPLTWALAKDPVSTNWRISSESAFSRPHERIEASKDGHFGHDSFELGGGGCVDDLIGKMTDEVLEFIRMGKIWYVHLGARGSVSASEAGELLNGLEKAELRRIRNHLRTHPVIFGHFTGFDIARLARLRCLKVTQKTLTSYYSHMAEFEAWARRRRVSVNLNNLDRHVTAFPTFLFEEGETQPSTGAYLVYGLQLLRCQGPRQAFLPKMEKNGAGQHAAPCARGVRAGCGDPRFGAGPCRHCPRHGHPIRNTYLRPTECVSLTRHHFAMPAGRRYKHWAIIVAPSELGETTQTGSSDDSVLVADLELRQALGLWVPSASGRVFLKLSRSQLEQRCKMACQQLRYKSCCVLHHATHPSPQWCIKRCVTQTARPRFRSEARPMAARNSVTRYEKHALLQRRWTQAEPDRLATITSGRRIRPMGIIFLGSLNGLLRETAANGSHFRRFRNDSAPPVLQVEARLNST